MSSFIGFRNTQTPSPFRFLYGMRNGVLLFPLDIVFNHFNPNTVDTTGMFLGAPVSGPGFDYGTIAGYNFPQLGAVIPVVEVIPDPAFVSTGVVKLPVLPLTVAVNGSPVEVNLNGTVIKGTVLALSAHAAYIDPVHQITAYIVQFNVPLLDDHHGAPVFNSNTGDLVGMVAATQRTVNAPNTLVCPL